MLKYISEKKYLDPLGNFPGLKKWSFGFDETTFELVDEQVEIIYGFEKNKSETNPVRKYLCLTSIQNVPLNPAELDQKPISIEISNFENCKHKKS